MRHVRYITCLIVVCFVFKEATANFKLCVSEMSTDDMKATCKYVGSEKCILESYGHRCTENVENRIADLAIAEPDEAIFGSMFKLNNTVVVGYIKPLSAESDVNINIVIVSNNKSKQNGLYGLRYCHLGNEVNIAPSILNKFENYIWKQNNVDLCYEEHETAVENYFYNLNTTFGPSCIPGRWAADYHLDIELKNRFPKLLQLCNSYEGESNPFIQTLNCLTSGQGDVAVTILEEFIPYKQKYNLSDEEYFYLCNDGTTQRLNNTCVWFKYSWPLLLANKEIVDDVKITLQESFPREVWDSSLKSLQYYSDTYGSLDFIGLLRKILFANSRTLHLVENTNLTEYIETFGTVTEKTTCKPGLRWCTRNEQETKMCLLLQKVSQFYGIEPRVEYCEESANDNFYDDMCIRSLMLNHTDITYINSDQLYDARKHTNKIKLDAVLYTKDTKENLIHSILLVNPAAVKNTDDLKNKKACFSKFGSIDWVSFIYAFRYQITNTSCNYYESLGDFVHDSCMPGVGMQDENAIGNHLCSLCRSSVYSPTKHNCKASSKENDYAGNQGALNCLKNADYAVLQIEKDLQLPADYMVMCKNGTLTNISEISDGCFLATSPSGAIVVAENNNFKKAIQLAFKEIEMASFSPRKFPLNPFEEHEESGLSLFGKSVEGFYIYNRSVNISHQPNYIGEHSVMVESVDICTKQIRVEVPSDETDSKSSGFLTAFFIIVGMGSIFGAAVFGWFKVRDGLQNNEVNNQTEDDNNENRVEMKIIVTSADQEDAINSEENDPLNKDQSEEDKSTKDQV